MNLIEETAIPAEAIPLAPFRAHLRMGTGFGEDTLQDGVLEGFLRAAIATVESRTGKVLVARNFVVEVNRWRDPLAQVLPVAPVRAVTEVVRVDADGGETPVTEGWWLARDAQRPALRATGTALPAVPARGSVRIRLVAGMGDTLGELPADLVQAVFLLAAHYYEYRDETSLSAGCMPFGATSLLARYVTPRLSGRA